VARVAVAPPKRLHADPDIARGLAQLRQQVLEGRGFGRALLLLGDGLERGLQLRLGDAELVGDAAEAAFAVLLRVVTGVMAVSHGSGRRSSAQ
jgi:hypothetical protein